MEQLQQSVASARRRLTVQRFLQILPLALCGALVLAAIGLAIPKIWVIEVDLSVWQWTWLAGSLAIGVVFTLGWTLTCRCDPLDAAIEIDHRCGLKERVSSALALSPHDLESDVGRALVEDASRKIEQIDVTDEFPVAADRRMLAPLLPVLVILGLFLLPNATQEKVQASSQIDVQKQIQKEAEELRKRLAEHKKRAEAKGLEDAEALFKSLQKGLDDLKSDNQVDRQKALVKMNDLAKEIEKRRNALGDSEKMKQQFSRLKNIERGPAEKVAGAMKEGDFQKALDELKKLSEKIKNGELSEDEKEQLANQMKKMSEKLNEMVQAHEDAKEALKRQIAQKEKEGDLEAAGRLQRQLDQLEKMDRQMERMQNMADQLAESEQQMRGDDPTAALEALDQMASELEEMQADMAQLQSLDELMDEISMSKDMMSEEMDSMDGYSEMDSMDQFQDGSNDGMGAGRGFGYRPEMETETGDYDARERAKPRAGEAIRVGDAFGPNRAGMTQEEIKQQILGSLKGETDPLTDQRLPKSQVDHVRQYYQRLSDGQ